MAKPNHRHKEQDHESTKTEWKTIFHLPLTRGGGSGRGERCRRVAVKTVATPCPADNSNQNLGTLAGIQTKQKEPSRIFNAWE